MSAVVYDVGYDTRKNAEKHGYCMAFGCYKRKQNFVKHRSPKKYQDFEARCHI